MIYNSRMLAFLLAICAGLLSTILLAIVSGVVNFTFLITTFLIILVCAFVPIYLALDKLIFHEIRKLQEDLDRVDMEHPTDDPTVQMNPFRKIYSVIYQMIKDKRSEIERLKNAEAFRKDFIADVSHELKTPIFAAQGFVHTLLDGAVKEKAVRKRFLKKAAKSLDGLDMLVQDLLTLSQIETGQIKMRFEEIDLYSLTSEVLEQLRGKANKKDITLRIEGTARKVRVYADAQRIEQVLLNLIVNAIKHSDEGSEVVVAFSVRKSSVLTSVIDSGEGIAAEHINRIFERFYRVDKSRSREKGGTGLGLAIVKHILDGHNSRAEVQSEPAKGSTFSFRLPRAKMEENANAEDGKSDMD